MRAPAAVSLSLAAALATGASAYPGGTPGYQTDVAPFCASCHSSRSEAEFGGLGDLAVGQLAENKHYAAIRAGEEAYGELTQAQRGELIEQLRALDEASTVKIEAPAHVAPGAALTVTVRVTGGAGPVVGVGLVDADHRSYARPAPSAGWQIAAPPLVTGPDGAPQGEWLAKRPEARGRSLSFVNVTGVASDAAKRVYAHAQVSWTLRAPSAPGTYPLAAAYWYGTEKACPLGTVEDAHGKQPRGGFTGASGRVLFSSVLQIEVR